MIKRAVVPTHSKSVKRRYSDHVENQFLDFDSKTGLLLPFLLLEACGLRLAAPREGNGRGSCSPPFVLLVTNTNPNQLTEGQDRPGKQGDTSSLATDFAHSDNSRCLLLTLTKVLIPEICRLATPTGSLSPLAYSWNPYSPGWSSCVRFDNATVHPSFQMWPTTNPCKALRYPLP